MKVVQLGKTVFASIGLVTGITLLVYLYGNTGGLYVKGTVPKTTVNNVTNAVYLGQGCFWHTQYDTVVIEQSMSGPFKRQDAAVTSLVGYAGGSYSGPTGAVCYHGLPENDYGKLGHAEAVSIELSGNHSVAQAQFSLLMEHFFTQGFSQTSVGMLRLDPGIFL
jgi:hypothetical protein